MGFLGGLAAAFAGAILWAIVTVATGYQIGYMAVGVGLMVGFAIRYAGKGIDPLFGYMGAGLSLFGCLLGNFFTLVGFASKEAGSGIFETFSLIDYGLVPGVMAESFGIMTLLFFGIALYEGYKFSIQKVTDEGFAAYLKAI
ncbi:MAG: hypothetical protein H6581_00115 [Bacteroidia bacterium]|nr:hypothetical protein [Bacteroidia bacterium]